MRKFSFKLYLVCSICFLILSCSKSREDKEIENPRLQAVKSLQFLEERKTAYQLLNSEEKATIWKQHLQEIISTVKFDSNKE